MNKILKILTIFIFLLGSEIYAVMVDDIVVFGDSLSDTGNNGRYSNGALWLEVLAEKLNLALPQSSNYGGRNFAYSGAMSGSEDSTDTVNVGNQIKAYLDLNGGKADPGALYIIWVGGNDFLDKRSPFDLLENVTNHIEVLVSAGATKFFVPNLPSLIHAPKGEELIKEIVDVPMQYLHESLESIVSCCIHHFVHASVCLYNMQLEQRLKCIECSRNIAIYHFDVFSIFNRVLGELELHGFSDKSELFFDPLHPSAKGHELIADSASKVLESRI